MHPDYRKFIARGRRRRNFRKMVTVLCCIVVFCTTYALILPAITMENTAFCGKQEHTHSEECRLWAAGQKLVCQLQEQAGHNHGDSCYAPAETVAAVIHEHQDTCLSLGALICETDHDHGADCYESTVICGMEEGQPEPAETAEPVLVCTEPVAQAHTHGEACFEETEPQPVTVCEIADAEHEHGNDCYQTDCGLEAHEHTLICFSDPEADVETPAVWEATFADVVLTGEWSDDVVAIAESQLGYTESSRNYDVREDNSVYGYSRYGAWYGMPYDRWDGMFAAFCLHYAGVEDMPWHADVRIWTEDLAAEGLYGTVREIRAQKGSVIFLDKDADGAADRAGIVAEVQEAQEHTGASIRVIEGDASNTVAYTYYSPEDPMILGYGLLPGQERVPALIEDAPAVYSCGLEEHTHTDSCYGDSGEPECGEEAHLHDETCTAESSEVFIESSSESVTVTYSAVCIAETETVPRSAMFRMYAVSPATTEEEETSAQSTPVDLSWYITEEGGTLSLSLWTMDNSLVGNNQIELGKQYQISLFFALPESGMEDGVYEYSLPSGFQYTTQSGLLYDSTKKVLLGEWVLQENGTLVFTFHEESNDYQDIAMTATIRTEVEENITEIPFNGQILVVFNPTDQEKKTTTVEKLGNGQAQQEDGTWVDSNADIDRIKWTVKIKPGTDGLPAGTLFEDILTSAHHYFSEADKATGITLGFNDAGQEWHQIKIPNEAITWNADNKGFSFLLPEARCEFCNNELVMFEDRQYYLNYYTTVMDGLEEGSFRHENEIHVADRAASAYVVSVVGAPMAYIVKSGRLDPATQDFKWKIETSISAYTGGQAYAWTIYDSAVIVDQNDYQWDVKENIDFDSQRFNGFAGVTATVNGVEYNVPYYREADPDDHPFAYSFTETNGIVFGHKCTCDADTCANWYMDSENDADDEPDLYCHEWPFDRWKQPWGYDEYYCTCWKYTEDVVFTFNTVYAGTGIIDQYGGQKLDFSNGVNLQAYRYSPESGYQYVETPGSKQDIPIPGMFDKMIINEPTSDNNYIASFRITLNEGKTDLSQLKQNIEIVDTMSDTLYYIPGTMVITQVDINDSNTVLTEGTDYTLTVAGHTITIALTHTGPYKYILDYDTQFYYENDGQNGEPGYTNNTSVSIKGHPYTATVGNKGVKEYTYTALMYEVTLHKICMDTKDPLPGAEFGLFAENGIEITRGFTDEQGNLSFATDLENDIVFKMHQPYYIQEITPPSGYILDDTKHWFYFCVDEADCEKCPNVTAYDGMVRLNNQLEETGQQPDFCVENVFGGPILPNTGGTGTQLYTVGGSLLMLAAVSLLYNRKKYGKKTCH